jgi:hypothetical protein
VSTDTICITAPAGPDPADLDLDLHEGWQALALASLGRVLTATELAVVARVPAELALDLWFSDLDDAARHEALSALGS